MPRSDFVSSRRKPVALNKRAGRHFTVILSIVFPELKLRKGLRRERRVRKLPVLARNGRSFFGLTLKSQQAAWSQEQYDLIDALREGINRPELR